MTDLDFGETFFNVLLCTVAWNGGGVNESGFGITTDPDFGEIFLNVLVCTVAWNGGGGEAEGWLSASATTFCGPGTCLKSVVNSEMYAICRTCRADQSGETRFIAWVRGMWSVRRRKFLPSKTKRKWRTAEKAANNSRSKVEYLTSSEEVGFVHKTLPSLCKIDYFHYHNKFIGNRRSAVLELQSFSKGTICELVYSI